MVPLVAAADEAVDNPLEEERGALMAAEAGCIISGAPARLGDLTGSVGLRENALPKRR